MKRSLARQRGGSLEKRVSRFLLAYRITPHATTGVAPCVLLMGRQLRSQLDLVRPDPAARVQLHQAKQKQLRDVRALHRQHSEGDFVLARDFSAGGRWKPARVAAKEGSASYRCIFEDDGRAVRRHVDHVRSTIPREQLLPETADDSTTLPWAAERSRFQQRKKRIGASTRYPNLKQRPQLQRTTSRAQKRPSLPKGRPRSWSRFRFRQGVQRGCGKVSKD